MNTLQLNKISERLKNYSQVNYKRRLEDSRKNLKIIKKILIRNKSKIVRAIRNDVNKDFKDCLSEFKSSLNILNYVIKNFSLAKIEKNFLIKNGKFGTVKLVPIGVVGIITPWNYPLLTLFERLPFCLASGCPVIIKPSEYSPAFSKTLKKIFNSNKNLFNFLYVIVDKTSKVGKKLCNDSNVSLISFVGSTKTGKKIIEQCAPTLKKTNLELGGKNSAIISDKSNINFAVQKVINGIFENGGQACVGISRVIIHERVYDLFLKKILVKINDQYNNKKLNFQIPATKLQRKKILSLLGAIKLNYFKNIIKIFDLGSKKYTPIFLKFQKNNKFFLKNEFFFPIVTFEKFNNLNDCIRKVNETEYGLACYIFSKNEFEIKKLINTLECGRIWVNSSLEWVPSLPVGGFNMSGGGRDMGIDGFKNYMTTKSVYKCK